MTSQSMWYILIGAYRGIPCHFAPWYFLLLGRLSTVSFSQFFGILFLVIYHLLFKSTLNVALFIQHARQVDFKFVFDRLAGFLGEIIILEHFQEVFESQYLDIGWVHVLLKCFAL